MLVFLSSFRGFGLAPYWTFVKKVIVRPHWSWNVEESVGLFGRIEREKCYLASGISNQ
jgi:hypothetical protein